MVSSKPKLVIHEDTKKVVAGRTYYLAEKITEAGTQGFWVSEEWKNKYRESK